MVKKTSFQTRREFLRRCLAASIGSAGWLGFGSSLQLASAALKDTSALPGYKALVCLYMDGGNDSYNMLVPTGSAYSTYQASRSNLAIASSQLHNLNGTAHGLHPAMPRLASRYNQGQVAFVNNVGTLVVPTTRAQVENESVPLPKQLFSHADQQKQWELVAADSSDSRGWLGRAADLLATYNNSLLPMNISMDDIRTLQIGDSAPYALNPYNLTDFEHRSWGEGDAARHQAFLDLQHLAQTHPMMQAFTQVHDDTLAIYEELSTDLAAVPAIPNESAYPTGQYLATQLKMVARVIKSQAAKSTVNRQIFMVRMGGYDFHDRLLNAQQERLNIVDQCVDAFFNTLNSSQWGGLGGNVTLFSLSEFARTLSSNGDGTDHAWGGVQFVVGDAVQGGMVGTYPDLTLDSSLDLGGGRLVPTLAVEQYAATLVRWLGLGDVELATIFPNLGNFNSNNLGFLP